MQTRPLTELGTRDFTTESVSDKIQNDKERKQHLINVLDNAKDSARQGEYDAAFNFMKPLLCDLFKEIQATGMRNEIKALKHERDWLLIATSTVKHKNPDAPGVIREVQNIYRQELNELENELETTA